jgi:hypothetical protein
MPDVATKLFREPLEAKKAVEELKAKGFKDDDILVVATAERAKALEGLKAETDASKLAGMGVYEETIEYYKYSLPSGGIVVSVKADESKLEDAKQVLRAVPVCSCGDRICGTSPGFQVASRMSATNPIDAPMSGDFRRY